MKLGKVDTEIGIMEDKIDHCVFLSDEWIVMKDLDVFVKVGSTDHPAKIDSMVRLSKELVDTKSLWVRWTSNNKKDVVYISSVQPTYSSEGDIQRRSTNHSKTKDQHPQSTTSLHSKISRDGRPDNSYCPRRLFVALSYECKHYISCNSLNMKQKTAKMVEKTKRLPQEVELLGITSKYINRRNQ